MAPTLSFYPTTPKNLHRTLSKETHVEILRLVPCGFMSLPQAPIALASTLTRDINKVWHTIAQNWRDGTDNKGSRGNASDKLLTSI